MIKVWSLISWFSKVKRSFLRILFFYKVTFFRLLGSYEEAG